MKKIIILFTLFNLFSKVNAQNKNSNLNNRLYTLTANYSPYYVATGEGKGILFKVRITDIPTTGVIFDSMVICNKSFPFHLKQLKNGFEIETNILVETELAKSNKLKIEKEIVEKLKFYPSFIMVTNHGKRSKITISNYKKNKQIPN